MKYHISYPNDLDILVNGIINDNVDNNIIYYIAPAPADYRNSFSGSGFPFHDSRQAFDNTPNHGCQYLKKNKYSIDLIKPNAYYDDNEINAELIYPHVTIYYDVNGVEKKFKINLDTKIPYRHIKYNEINHNMNVSFYSNKDLPIRTQEQILLDSQYSTTIDSKKYWKLKPPM
jgi:hypothetical protein